MIGRTLSHYSISDKLGMGGMGMVYLAQDTRLNRPVALKLLLTEIAIDVDFIRRFEEEARVLSALNHPNILTIYDLGQFGGLTYIVSEHVEGENLRERQIRRPLELDEALDVAVQIADALNATHNAGIVHRDIKPENIMIREDGIIKVIDFGLAVLFEKKIKEINRNNPTLTIIPDSGIGFSGTPAYMSPEQLQKDELDARSDIWGLGILLYEMLTGTPPFYENNFDTLKNAILTGKLKPLPENIPHDVSRIVLMALQKKRENRYQVMKDFLLNLKEVRNELESLEKVRYIKRLYAVKERFVGLIKRNKKVSLLITSVLILIALISGFWVNNYIKKAQARQLYTEGMEIWKKRDKPLFPKALSLFERAVAKDPNFTLAYVGLADTYVLQEEYLGVPSRETLYKAEENAKIAIQMDSSLADGYASLGFIKNKEWEWVAAEKEFKKAIELNSDYSTARQWYCIFLRNLGRDDEALTQIKIASDHAPSSEVVKINLIITYLLRGDTTTAEEIAKALLTANPAHWGGRSWLGMVQLEQGNNNKEAISNLEAGIDHAKKGHTLLANLGYGYAVTKDVKVNEVLTELEGLFNEERATGQDLAKVYVGLGENKKALEWLEKDFVSHSGDLPHISWHPTLKSLYDDPDFINLLSRMGLKPRVNLHQIAQ